MKKKRNMLNTPISTVGYIKKYFGDDISKILVASNRLLQSGVVPYVHHYEAENVLERYLYKDTFMDKSIVFTGLTGSGKTTIVRHVFGFEDSANKPRFRDNSILIPIDFNRSQKSADTAILSGLRVAINMICNTYKIDYPGTENGEFYKYIKFLRPDVLEMKSGNTPATEFHKKMDKFCTDMPTTFASCQLQYVMDQEECKLDLVVLIVDNIEAFMQPKSKYLKSSYLTPVIEAFKLADCIGQRKKPTKWSFNMVIACRHHIWRIIKGEYTENSSENTLLQSYVTTETPYDLAKPVDVNDIIKKRDEVFSKRRSDKEKWNTAVNVVNTVLKKTSGNIGDFILQLELKDIRKSMLKMQELILHNGLQRQSDEEIIAGSFQITSPDQFDLTRVNLVRTIGLGDHKFYSDMTSSIPNLLYNEQKDGMELYPLLTLKYFLRLCGYAEPAWDNSVSIPQFYDTAKVIFSVDGNTLLREFEISVQFLIQHRLLLRSADQSQEEVPGLSIGEINQIERVYVSGAAVSLWKELASSSALFQLFIDDIWVDNNSDYFGEDGNDIEYCVKYLTALYKIEQRIYNHAHDISARSERLFIECFGTTPICKQLVDGLISSLNSIILSDIPQPLSRINAARKTLVKARNLSAEFCKWKGKRIKFLNR